jgi:uncharacterized membrane protein HdeD (DUF308 family)
LLAFLPTVGAALVPYALGGLSLFGGVATVVGAFKRRAELKRWAAAA